MDAGQGRALPADLRQAGLQDRRALQVLGRAGALRLGRRAGLGGRPARVRRAGRHRGALRRPRHGPAARRRRRERRARAPGPPQLRGTCPRGGPRRGRLRGEPGDAHPLSRPRLGPGQGPRRPLQHRGRHPHGAGRRRACPIGHWSGCHAVGVGPQRARPSATSQRRRPLPEALLPAGASSSTSDGRAVRRRRGRLPQLHLRQVRARDPQATAAQPAFQIFDAKVIPTSFATSTSIRAGLEDPSPTASRGSRRWPRRRRTWMAFVKEIRRAIQRRSAQPGEFATTAARRWTKRRTEGIAVRRSRTGRCTLRRRRPTTGFAVHLRHHLHLRRPAHRPATPRCSIPKISSQCPGLFAAGELVGVASSTTTTRAARGSWPGAVFGKIAGEAAGRAAVGNE